MKTIVNDRIDFFKLLLILVSVGIIGCSSKDDNTDDSKSKSVLFVGTWKPIKDVEVCFTGSEIVDNYSACDQKGLLTINSNATYNQTFYYTGGSGTCIQYEPSNGNWEIANDALKVYEDGNIIDVTFFVVTQTVLKLGQYEVDPEYTCDGDNLPSHYYTEFIRI